jgi:hypothetical protein
MIIIGIYYSSFRAIRAIRYLGYPRNDPYPISQNVGKKFYRRDLVQTVDLRTGKSISHKMKWIITPSRISGDSLAVYCTKNNKKGFLDINTGKIFIKAKYRNAFVFRDSLAAVIGKDGKVGFIRPDGSYSIPPIFSFRKGHDYVFRNGYCWIPDSDNLYGAIDKTGQWVIEPQFSSLDTGNPDVYVVSKEGKYGLLDTDLRWIFEPVYQDITINDEDNRTVYVTKDGIKQLLTFDGRILEPFIVESAGALIPDTWTDENSFHSVKFDWFIAGEGMGVIERATGRIIIPPIFEDVELLSEDLLFCTYGHYYGHGVIYDSKGNPLGENLARETAEAIAKKNAGITN